MRELSLLLAVLAVSGCETTASTPPAPPAALRKGVLSGTVTYRERMALPTGAQVTVRVWDALEPPTTAMVGETKFAATGQVPLPFELFFDPTLIQDSHVYGARATISAEGVTWFETEKPVPVLTQGAPTVDVELVVKRVSPPS